MPSKPRKPSRRRPRQDRSKETVACILEAAAQVLATDGYASSTTNRIAERAGVSVGSIYQYFGNKDAVFSAVVQRYVDSVRARLAEELEHVDLGDLSASLPHIVEALLAEPIDKPHVARAVLDHLPHEAGMGVIDAAESQMIAIISASLQRNGVEGDVARLRAEVTVRAFGGALNLTLRRAPDRLHDPAYRAEFVRLVEGYLTR